MEPKHLIVGLGNPGSEYEKTRHNAGFMLVERLVQELKINWTNERKFLARIAQANSFGKKLVLCEPQTFMNLSGEAVGSLVKYYQLPLSNILVVVDDADLSLGEIRLRPNGGSGGHHGLDSVTHHLGSHDYARLRIGIGRKNDVREIAGYVLSKFDAGDRVVFEQVMDRAVDQIKCWLSDGLQKAMSQFNGAISLNKEEK
jgi:PTH1 family peptidyl-tRNA hydrolase